MLPVRDLRPRGGNGWSPRASLRAYARCCALRVVPRDRLLKNGPTAGLAACLTFDDGPDPDFTPGLLDTLREEGVRATFFVIGRRAEKYPEIVRRMVEDGHSIGHHTYTHSWHADVSAGLLMAEIRKTDEVLMEIVGGPSQLFRPPWGKLTPWKLFRLLVDGRRIMLWNKDPRDCDARTASDVMDWFGRNPISAGDVVLMHDDKPFAAQVLPELIAEARARGICFTTLDEWACPFREARAEIGHRGGKES